MKGRYNHLYALGFSVDSDYREGAAAAEILQALRMRLVELQRTGEILEAVGVPEETLDNVTGWAVDPAQAFTSGRNDPSATSLYATAAANDANRSPGSG